MATTEIIKRLFIAFAKQDTNEFYHQAEDLINLEKRKKHTIVARELKEALYSKPILNNGNNGRRYKSNILIPRDTEKGFPLLEIREYDIDWESLVLSEKTKSILKQIVKEMKDSEILETYNLRPKNKVLFCGKPGTGKTFSAQLISSVLHIPLVYIRFDSIISSYLGETATNLRKVFDFISNEMWIVLFDEFDIIGKNRDDHYEHGEIKRVVNNFLQMLDNFEGQSLIIAATNHQHILDSAIWRRFDEVIYFELPDKEKRLHLLELYLKPMQKEDINLSEFIEKTKGFAPSDLRMMCIEAMKYSIINDHNVLKAEDIDFALSRFLDRTDIREGQMENK
ncbi:MAG: ATP-binding protein [bacterium]|nr:ATP-binding protein [bacterium]